MRSTRRGPSPSLVTLAALVPLGTLALLAACNRAPEEPAPVASSRAQEVVIAASRPSASAPAPKPVPRCVVETPADPGPVPSAVPAAACPRDPERAEPLPTVMLVAPEAVRGTTKIIAELAKTDRDRERGLMFRTAMAEDHGMLFDMGTHVVQGFWMKNTCLPLDMLFIDDDGLVVGLLENVPTLNLEERTVACPSSYVLEMNAGWARRHGVRAGQKILLPPTSGK